MFNEVTYGLNSISIVFDDEVLAGIILGQMPESWSTTCQSIANSFGKEKLAFQQVVNMIMTQEIRMREEGSGASSSALNVEGKESRNMNRNRDQRGRSKSRRRSKSRNRQGNNSSNQQRSKKDIECWNCGKMGHYSNECKSGKKDDGKSSANCVSEEVDDCLICALESKMESWVLDSRASFHATSHMDLFKNYISGNFGKVYLGDDQACDITEKGDVKIQLNGSVLKLDNVRHVPDLRKNLISIGQLASDGYVTTFTGDKWKISKGAMTIACGTKNGTLYTTTDGCGLAAVAEGKEDPNLWHQKFGHMSSQGLKCLQSRGKLLGLKSVEVDFCELYS